MLAGSIRIQTLLFLLHSYKKTSAGLFACWPSLTTYTEWSFYINHICTQSPPIVNSQWNTHHFRFSTSHAHQPPQSPFMSSVLCLFCLTLLLGNSGFPPGFLYSLPFPSVPTLTMTSVLSALFDQCLNKGLFPGLCPTNFQRTLRCNFIVRLSLCPSGSSQTN